MIAIVGNYLHVKYNTTENIVKKVIVAESTIISSAVSTSGAVFLATKDGKIWRVNLSESKDVVQENSEDIFGDLLEEDNNAGLDSQTEEAQDVVPLKSSNLFLSTESLLLDIIVVGDHLYVLTEANGLAVIHVYALENTSKSPQLFKELDLDIKSLQGNKHRVMYAAVVEEQYKNIAQSESLIYLSKTLFASLFGSRTAILNFAVILVVTNNGCVLSFPIKSSPLTSHQVICQLDQKITGLTWVKATSPQCESVNNGVISVLEEAMQVSSGDEVQTGLCVCSENGDCCLLLTPSKSAQDSGKFQFLLPTPVKCCIFIDPYLVYSTGRSVEACKLTIQSCVGGTVRTVAPEVRTLTQRSGVVQLFRTFPHEYDSEMSHVMCLTNTLETFPICLENKSSVQDLGAETGLSSLLEKIKESSRDLSHSKQEVKQQDNYIQQLNIFTHLLLMNKHRLSKKLVSCKCRTFSHQNGYTLQRYLEITLENLSSFALSSDWLVSLSVEYISQSNSNSASTGDVFNFSYPLLNGLNASSEFVSTLPLCDSLVSLPLTRSRVTVRLVLKQQSLLNLETSSSGSASTSCKAVSVIVHQEIIDCFHFLSRPNVFSPSGVARLSVGKSWLRKELEALAEQRSGGQPATKTGSTGFNSNFVEAKCCVPKVNGLSHTSDCVSLLRWLLQDSDVPSSCITAPLLQVQGADGSRVTISIELSQGVSSDNTNSSQCVFTVTLKSSDFEALSHMHQALGHRIKNLIKTSNENEMPAEKLKKALPILQKKQRTLASLLYKLQNSSLSDSEMMKLLNDCYNQCSDLAMLTACN